LASITAQRPSRVLLVGVAFASFVGIGLPGGVLGVAWPSIRTSFGLSLDAIGALLTAQTAGYLLVSFNNGRILSRLRTGWFLAIGSMVGGLGLLGYALASTWEVMVLCGVLAGMGSGAIDAAMNTYFAAHYGPSLMNWLHACFGIGAAVGPAIATALLNSGLAWQWAYGLVAVVQALLGAGFALTSPRWLPVEPEHSTAQAPAAARTIVDTLKLPAVWLSITLFFVFTGLEGSGGQWPYTLFTEARSIRPATAGLWVSVYWASLTIGRILFGIAARYASSVSLLRASMLGAAWGAVLIWWNPSDGLSFMGLAIMGFSLAPIFPLSISNTPKQLGPAHAANAIGLQVAAASLGLAALPGLGGVLAENLGLESIGPFLVVLAVIMVLLHESAVRRAMARGRR
jgi:fucose permease